MRFLNAAFAAVYGRPPSEIRRGHEKASAGIVLRLAYRPPLDWPMLLRFLAAEFAAAPLLVAGFSFGCWVGLRAGCEDARVEKLIGIGAPVNDSDFSYLAKCAKPKLFVHGSNDEHGDVKKVRQMVSALPGENEMVVVEGVDHFFTGKVDELGNAIRGWLEPAMHNVARGL